MPASLQFGFSFRIRLRPTEASRSNCAASKPYGYSLFNLDAMSTICQILSTREENLWTFELPDGRGIRRAVACLAPYIRNKRRWPKSPT